MENINVGGKIKELRRMDIMKLLLFPFKLIFYIFKVMFYIFFFWVVLLYKLAKDY